jgi:hypothetical protein
MSVDFEFSDLALTVEQAVHLFQVSKISAGSPVGLLTLVLWPSNRRSKPSSSKAAVSST